MRISFLPFIALFLAGTALAQVDPATLPARDQHEGLLIAADPFPEAAQAKHCFGKADPWPAGILAINVYFRNSTPQPMHVNLGKIRLVLEPPGAPRQSVEPLALEDVAAAILHPHGAPNPGPARTRLPEPFPLPRRDKKLDKILERLRPLALNTDVVPPSATIHGFLFFDVSHDFSLVSSSSLYLPDVKVLTTGQPLMYFEVDLRRAARR